MTKFRSEKNIYSKFILQRILDHWGVGEIEGVTYFDFKTPNVWRHFIETNQGSFELFSYPAYKKDRSEKVIFASFHQLKDQSAVQSYYRFGRHHLLIRLTKKHLISVKQAMTDFKLLEGQKIRRIFRVYGSILQIILDDDSDISSYGGWHIKKTTRNRQEVIVSSSDQHREITDSVLKEIQSLSPTIMGLSINNDLVKMRLSNNLSLSFQQRWGFPAVEAHAIGRKNEVVVYSEKKIYYVKSEVKVLY